MTSLFHLVALSSNIETIFIEAAKQLEGLDFNMDNVQFPVSNKGYADFKWAVQLNRFSLKLIGLWPNETASLQERLNSNLRLFGSIIVITFICIMPSLHLLLKIWGDIMAMIDNFVITIPLVTISVKLLILWQKREALSSLTTMIAQDWIKSKSYNERNVMIRHAQNSRLIIIFNYTISFSTSIMLIVTSAFGYNVRQVTNATYINKPLPFQGYYIYDASVSPQFELTFLAQSISLIFLALSYTSTDNFLALLVFHICGQFENLTSHLYQMRESKDFIVALKKNVIDHIRLIRSVAIIEDTFTLMLLLLFLYFGFMVCTCGFMIVTVIFEDGRNISVKRALFLIMVVNTSFTHMCVYCAVGELLIMKYEEVYNAVYEFEWYKLKMKEARNLIFLLIRINKPLYITAGKILPMTMATFCSILKTSGGYISVLLANRN